MEERRLYRTVLFAGTTEGRELSELLVEAGIEHTVCVATEYGEVVLKQHPLVHVRRGRMDRSGIRAFVEEGRYRLVVDATHPFAREVSRNIQEALRTEPQEGARPPFTAGSDVQEALRTESPEGGESPFATGSRNIKEALGTQSGTERDVIYLRLKRKGSRHRESGVTYFETDEDCAQALEDTVGNILLTTGSRELARYCRKEEVRSRLYVRVLPGMESLAHCMEQGIRGKQIIAMQGPFTAKLNEAVMEQYGISCLVTKESGSSGGYPEKLRAAEKVGAKVFVIGRPEEEGSSFEQVCDELERLFGRKIRKRKPLEIVLAGIGMGSEEGLTGEVKRAVGEADILFGAERLLAGFPDVREKHPFYREEQVIPCLRSMQGAEGYPGGARAVVLFSGDSGFYSGCPALHRALEKEIREGRLEASVRILPGISSVAYMAARTGESYHDAAVCSMHGREGEDVVNRIKRNRKTFLLTSGVGDIRRLGKALLEADMPECEIITGFRLSYEEERIESRTHLACTEMTEEGLYTCLIKNPCAEAGRLTHGIPDERFIREKIPMTKEEVREVCICKLCLREGAVVYDIGGGTGSVAVEIAGLSDRIQVYAVEQREEAAALIEKNRDRFGLSNISVVRAAAPEGLSALPAPTQAFIGGSGGRLKEIVSCLLEKNPKMRIVITAVSMETVCEIKELSELYPVRGEEIVQMQVSRARKAGAHRLMQAENPVWICAFDFYGQ